MENSGNANASSVGRIVAIFAAFGLNLLDEQKATLEAKADGVLNEGITATADALESGLNGKGLVGAAETGIKDDVTKALPNVETSADAAFNSFVDHVEVLLKDWAAKEAGTETAAAAAPAEGTTATPAT